MSPAYGMFMGYDTNKPYLVTDLLEWGKST